MLFTLKYTIKPIIQMYKLIVRPFLFRCSADSVHEKTVEWASKRSQSTLWNRLTRMLFDYQSPHLEQTIFGLHFRNPVGLAAGFDKNGSFSNLMTSLGFGFCEIGSITAVASTGNPYPRSFRLPVDRSLINRMGLNNDGAEAVLRRVEQQSHTIPLGINIAKTHDPDIVGQRAVDDYFHSFQLAKQIADYITLNISCPNTREGKTFEVPDALDDLLNKLQIDRDDTSPPVLLKLSSDLDPVQLEELLNVSEQFSVAGYVATNTSTSRDGLKTDPAIVKKIGRGGLSGMAIKRKSTALIETVYELTKGEKLIIGAGGIFSADDAIEKIKAGADLLQIYTGMIYEGPSLVKQINRGLDRYLKLNNLSSINEIRK